MAKPISRRARAAVNSEPARKPQRVKRKSHTQDKTLARFARNSLLAAWELVGLLVIASLAIAVMLGYAATWFSGTGLLTHLLPFSIGVLVLLLLLMFFISLWWRIRRLLYSLTVFLPAALSVSLALLTVWSVSQGAMSPAFHQFRTLVGGKEEVGRITLAHQVYAAYRRHGRGPLQGLVKRSRVYRSVVEEAAESFGIDPDLLFGVAAAESSFMPRDSRDGGHGLFQLTRVPKIAIKEAGLRLEVQKPSVSISRHNAFIAAATLNYYLQEMNHDLFLGLLAYNIGPSNGGLRFIMDRYGVDDFVTIQPYLKELPRDYPIRVLSYALAFRIWRQQRLILPYEKADNALLIQRIGIPGLDSNMF